MLNKLHELACTDRRLACLTQDRIQSDINFIKLRMFRLEQAERRGEGWLYVKEDPAQAQARHEFFKDQQLFLSQLSPLVIAPPGANTVYGDPKTFVEGSSMIKKYTDYPKLFVLLSFCLMVSKLFQSDDSSIFVAYN